MLRTRLLTLVLGSSLLFTSLNASASERFFEYFTTVPEGENPAEWFNWNGRCELCHSTSAGGAADPRTTPFIQSLLGATGGAIGSVDRLKVGLEALAADQASGREATDSDEDGVSDLDELYDGMNPNDPGCKTPGCFSGFSGPAPEFGCIGSIASSSARASDRSPLIAAFLTACALVVSRRRRPAKRS